MILTEKQAVEQLRVLIESLGIKLPDYWMPFDLDVDDKYVLQWVKHPDNEWCSGKKYDFDILTRGVDYHVGLYAETILLVLGIKVIGHK